MSWYNLTKKIIPSKALNCFDIYWVGAGIFSSACIYDFSVDFLTKGDDNKPFYTDHRNTLIRCSAFPLSLIFGFTFGPILLPPIFITSIRKPWFFFLSMSRHSRHSTRNGLHLWCQGIQGTQCKHYNLFSL